jgi:hypothetical protein
MTQAFSAKNVTVPAYIDISDSLFTTVNFVPAVEKTYADTLLVYNNSAVSPYRISLSGQGRSITAVQPAGDVVPKVFSLEQNFPNPFNPSTTIEFNLPVPAAVTLTIYDVSGRTVSELIRSDFPAGQYHYRFDAGNLSSGIYLYRISAASLDGGNSSIFQQVKKLVLLK